MDKANEEQPTKLQPFTYLLFFNYLKTFPLFDRLERDVLKTVICTPKEKYKSFEQFFKISFLDFLAIHKPTPKPPHSCQQLLTTKAYICYSCQENNQALLCQSCFQSMPHQKMCRYTVKELPDLLRNVYTCCCGQYGTIGQRGTCGRHRRIVGEVGCGISGEGRERFVGYFLGCLEFYFMMCQAVEDLKADYQAVDMFQYLYILNENYIEGLLRHLQNLNASTSEYLKLTQKCLLTDFDPSLLLTPTRKQFQLDYPKPLLIFLLQKYEGFRQSYIYSFIGQILELENVQIIRLLFLDALESKSRDLMKSKLREIKSLRANGKIRPEVFCEAVEEIGEKVQAVDMMEALELYVDAATPAKYLTRQQKSRWSLSKNFESLNKKSFLTIQNLQQVKSSSLFSIISNTSSNKPLFLALLKNLIAYTHEKTIAKYETKQQSGRKISLSEMCNLMAKLIFGHLEGDCGRVEGFLGEIEMDGEIAGILYYFLGEALGNTSHLSQQTVMCFGLFLYGLRYRSKEQYEAYVAKWSTATIQPERLLDLLAKIVNILIGQQMKYLAKLSTYRDLTPEERHTIQTQQQQKFKQLLYMQRQIPKKQIEILHKEGILNFPNATKIFKEYTTFLRKSNSFVYSHPEGNFCFDGITNGIFCMTGEADGLRFTPQREDTCFQGKFRKQVLLGLLAPILGAEGREVYLQEQLDPKLFKTVSKNHDYVKHVCFIIVDKIVNGEIKQLREYLLTKRAKIGELSQSLEKLLGREKYMIEEKESIKIKKEEIQMETTMQIKMESSQNQEQAKSKQQSCQTEIQKKQQSQTQTQSQQPPSPLPAQKTTPSKLQKLKQKFSLKQAQILQIHKENCSASDKKQHVDTCMTCKEENHHDNALFYLGVLKRQGQENKIFQSAYSCEYSATLCMHLIHEKCFLKLCSNNTAIVCPLCKISSNILFPLQNHALSPQTLQFLQNRLTYTFIQSFSEYHPDRCFPFLLKNIISEVLFFLIFNVILSGEREFENVSKVQLSRKIEYYMGLLGEWWRSMRGFQREFYWGRMKGEVQELRLKKGKMGEMGEGEGEGDPKGIVDQIVMNLVWGKILDKDNRKEIEHQLRQLQMLIEPKQFKHLLTYIQTFLTQPLSYTPHSNPNPNPTSLTPRSFINHYFNPPTSIPILQSHLSTCWQCNKKNDARYYCLYCNISYCQACNHQKVHGGLRARIDWNGVFQFTDKKGNGRQRKVYRNSYGIDWGTANYVHHDYFDYFVDQAEMSQGLYDWLREIRN